MIGKRMSVMTEYRNTVLFEPAEEGVLKHPDKPGFRVILPWHSKDLKLTTLTSIIYQAGFTTEEFLDFL